MDHRYEEALEKARKGMPIDEVFPELKESEDERIRKWLIEIVEEIRKANPNNAEHNGNCSEAIAYLERHKEQKYYTYEQSKQAAEDCYYDKGYNTEDGGRCNQQSFLWGFEEGVDWCEQQKEKKPVEDTALQKAFINSKIDYMLEEKCDASDYAETILPTNITYGENEEEYKLHKIIEAAFIAGKNKKRNNSQSHWKPSEKQMDALKNARYMMSQSGDYYDTTAIIDSLITDLQKLL